MRAKDFFDFFCTIPFTVMDPNPIPEKIRVMKWRVVPDLRHVIPGDIICYRPRGSAAGGAAFTLNDRRDISNMLKAVRTAQLWHEIRNTGGLVTKNVARDERVLPWVRTVKHKLGLIEIFSIKECYKELKTINSKLRKIGQSALTKRTLEMIRECCETRTTNTGHIVFASGPAQFVGDNEYRIRVVHSTKYGKKDAEGKFTTGVQEYYRRFTLVELDDGTTYWTRQKMRRVAKKLIDKPAHAYETDDEDENPDDDMDEDRPPDYDDHEDDITNPNSGDDKQDGAVQGAEDGAAQSSIEAVVPRISHIEVIGARMCF
jgi:hypothetical protein